MNEKRFDFADQNKPENTKQTDEQPHSDKSFYENLPFQGLKNPPKQVFKKLKIVNFLLMMILYL